MAAGWFQISAGVDLNTDLYSAGYDDFDIIAPTEVNAVFAPINGPISNPAPWSMEYRTVRAGFIRLALFGLAFRSLPRLMLSGYVKQIGLTQMEL